MGLKARVVEQRKRESVVSAAVESHAVRSRSVKAAGHAVEHVADVANKGALDRRRLDPPPRGLDLEPSDGVLVQEREETVVAVLADTPLDVRVSGRGARGITEDPEEQQRVRSAAPLKVIWRQLKALRNAPHHGITQPPPRSHVLEHGLAEPGRVGEHVRPVQRGSGFDKRMLGPKLGAKIKPLFPVRAARRELAARAEIAAPRFASQAHGPLKLPLLRLSKKLARDPLQTADQLCRYAVVRDVKEPVDAARSADLCRH
eukprot:Amastigsp_a686828_5.p2 type:complete len:259 gc:universal Amastigsp_a686828_5:838-1614(+)